MCTNVEHLKRHRILNTGEQNDAVSFEHSVLSWQRCAPTCTEHRLQLRRLSESDFRLFCSNLRRLELVVAVAACFFRSM